MKESDARKLGETIAFVTEDYLPFRLASVPIWDLGFLQGVTVTERLRTVRKQVWLVDEHLLRLSNGLETCGIPLPFALDRISQIVAVVVSHNQQFLNPVDELSIGIGVTAGDGTLQSPDSFLYEKSGKRPLVQSRLVVHATRLASEKFADQYRQGIQLYVSSIHEIPGESIPRSIKSRSRLHYWLAERDPRFVPGQTFPVLLDHEGNLAESPTATIAIVSEGERTICLPPVDAILPGVTLGYLQAVFKECGIKLNRRTISASELFEADEVLWFSTPTFVLPVVTIDGRSIGNGTPGPVAGEILRSVQKRLGIALS